MQRMSAASLHRGDVVFAISYTGRTKATIESAKIQRSRCYCHWPHKRSSPLSDHCSITLGTDTAEDTEVYTPAVSRLVHLVIVDILATGVTLRRGQVSGAPQKSEKPSKQQDWPRPRPEMANKLYRHRKYAGSPGDVWKHFICGLPKQTRDGEYQVLGGDGFTLFTTGPHGVVASAFDAGSKKNRLGRSSYFHHQQTFFFEKKIYLGFWGLCTQIISNQSNLTLDVFENQTNVYEDCQKFLRKYDQSQKIRLFNSSSFDANFSNYDLAFIDPTYRRKDEQGDDWLKVVELCERLESEM